MERKINKDKMGRNTNNNNVRDWDLEIPTDDETDEDDDRFTEDAIRKRAELHDKKCQRHEDLVRNFTNAETFEEAYKCMVTINKFEEMHLKIPLEYKVIGEMMNRLRGATGKEKFMLQQKLHRALKVVQWKEKYDPNNQENYGIIEREEDSPSVKDVEEDKEEFDLMRGVDDDGDDEGDFEDDKDAELLEKLSAIDKNLEDKLALLDHTFGRKGRALEEEIKDLADERNALTEANTRPLYRKGFKERLITVNRTCKVTKGGQVASFTALVACGNLHGVVGFARAKGPKVPIALQKARVKCFQNLHYVELHEEHTIAHAVQSNYKKTKVYLWPASTRTGMIAGKTVKCILKLAGFKNIKSKVIGSRNPLNTVKAVFKALNAIETPKDVQEKFGRTVVESYLL
ncbi:hypothetical protein IFM89_018015 [Coptis chinensis]|uniref:S5 DRBM domain-containing protein n=1 Tax=Coptis chinensis TaxID=261450 RepID=A0A835HWH5_9MAGN|nr:hypothetical protein IFM89_018015 [Coptis chinensis]